MANPQLEWRLSEGLTDYETALRDMEARAAAIYQDAAAERIWLLEHPPLYTAGTSAKQTDLVEPDRFPVFETGRGGEYTYHGPGQRIIYVQLDLARRGRDIRGFVRALEEWIVSALALADIEAWTAAGRVGVWTDAPAGEAKIAAIGVRVRRWVTMHGAALNVDPDLSHYGGIVPCGLPDYPVTSLAALGKRLTMTQTDELLRRTCPFL